MTYLDLNGTALGEDVAVRLRGLQPTDPGSWYGTFDGHPGHVSCDEIPIQLTPEPWSERGAPDNEELAGGVVLNPSWLPIENDTTSLSALKARY